MLAQVEKKAKQTPAPGHKHQELNWVEPSAKFAATKYGVEDKSKKRTTFCDEAAEKSKKIPACTQYRQTMEPYENPETKKKHFNKITQGVIDPLPDHLGFNKDGSIYYEGNREPKQPRAEPVDLKFAHGTISTHGFTRYTDDAQEARMQYACKGDYLTNDQYHAATTPGPGHYFDEASLNAGKPKGVRTSVQVTVGGGSFSHTYTKAMTEDETINERKRTKHFAFNSSVDKVQFSKKEN